MLINFSGLFIIRFCYGYSSPTVLQVLATKGNLDTTSVCYHHKISCRKTISYSVANTTNIYFYRSAGQLKIDRKKLILAGWLHCSQLHSQMSGREGGWLADVSWAQLGWLDPAPQVFHSFAGPSRGM